MTAIKITRIICMTLLLGLGMVLASGVIDNTIERQQVRIACG